MTRFQLKDDPLPHEIYCANCKYATAFGFQYNLVDGQLGDYFICILQKKMLKMAKLNHIRKCKYNFVRRPDNNCPNRNHPNCLNCKHLEKLSWVRQSSLRPTLYHCNVQGKSVTIPTETDMTKIQYCGKFVMRGHFQKLPTSYQILRAQAEAQQKEIVGDISSPEIVRVSNLEEKKIKYNMILNGNYDRELYTVLWRYFYAANDENSPWKLRKETSDTKITFRKASTLDLSTIMSHPQFQAEINATANKKDQYGHDMNIIPIMPEQMWFRRTLTEVNVSKKMAFQVDNIVKIIHPSLYSTYEIFRDQNRTRLSGVYTQTVKMHPKSNIKARSVMYYNIFKYRFLFSDYHQGSQLLPYQLASLYLLFHQKSKHDIWDLPKLYTLHAGLVTQFIIQIMGQIAANLRVRKGKVSQKDWMLREEIFPADLDVSTVIERDLTNYVISKIFSSPTIQGYLSKMTVTQRDSLLSFCQTTYHLEFTHLTNYKMYIQEKTSDLRVSPSVLDKLLYETGCLRFSRSPYLRQFQNFFQEVPDTLWRIHFCLVAVFKPNLIAKGSHVAQIYSDFFSEFQTLEENPLLPVLSLSDDARQTIIQFLVDDSRHENIGSVIRLILQGCQDHETLQIFKKKWTGLANYYRVLLKVLETGHQRLHEFFLNDQIHVESEPFRATTSISEIADRYQLFIEVNFVLFYFHDQITHLLPIAKALERTVQMIVNHSPASATNMDIQKVRHHLIWFLRSHGVYLPADIGVIVPITTTEQSVETSPSQTRVPSDDFMSGGKFRLMPVIPEIFRGNSEWFNEGNRHKGFKLLPDGPTGTSEFIVKMKYFLIRRILNHKLSAICTNLGLAGRLYAEQISPRYLSSLRDYRALTPEDQTKAEKKKLRQILKFSDIVNGFNPLIQSATGGALTKSAKLKTLFTTILADPITFYQWIYSGYLSPSFVNRLKYGNHDLFKNTTSVYIQRNLSRALLKKIQRPGALGSGVHYPNLAEINSKNAAIYTALKTQLLGSVDYPLEDLAELENATLNTLAILSYAHKKFLFLNLTAAAAESTREARTQILRGFWPNKYTESVVQFLESSEMMNILNEKGRDLEAVLMCPSHSPDLLRKLTSIWKVLAITEISRLNAISEELAEQADATKKATLIYVYQRIVKSIRHYLELIATSESPDSDIRARLQGFTQSPIIPTKKYLWGLALTTNTAMSQSMTYLTTKAAFYPNVMTSVAILAAVQTMYGGNVTACLEISDEKIHAQLAAINEKFLPNELNNSHFAECGKVDAISAEKLSPLPEFKALQIPVALDEENLTAFTTITPFKPKPDVHEKILEPLSFLLPNKTNVMFRDDYQTMTRKIRSFGETTIKLIFNSTSFEYCSEGEGTSSLEQKVTKLLQTLHPGDPTKQNDLRQQLVLIDEHKIPNRKPIKKKQSPNDHIATLKALEMKKADLEVGLQKIQVKIAAKHANISENQSADQHISDLTLIPLHRIKSQYKAKIKQISIKIARLSNQWNATPINYANIYKYLDFSKHLTIEDVMPPTTIPKVICVADLEQLGENGQKFTDAEIQALEEPMQLEIRLSKNVIRKIKAGAEILSILIIPPKHPDHHVEANVTLTGPLHAVHPVPKMFQELPALTPSVPIAAIGIDMNRFPSWRAMSYGFLSNAPCSSSTDHRPVVPSPQTRSELIANLPHLIGLPASTPIEISLNTTEIRRVQKLKQQAKRRRDCKHNHELHTQRQNKTKKERFLRVNRAKVSPSEPSHYLNGILRKAYAWEKDLLPSKFYPPKKYHKVPMAAKITQILNQRCMSERNPSRALSFNDVISAPIIYWTQKLRHIERHIAQTQTIGSKLPSRDPKKKRVAGEITLLHHRKQSLRNEINRYMARTLFYVIRKFKPAVIGYENLSSMSTFGTKGYLAKITQEMIKRMGKPSLSKDADFSLILARVNAWCRLSDPPMEVAFHEVNARNTSKYHYHCGGQIDRKPTWDFGGCMREDCEEAYDIDTHVNAAYNIASRAMGHTGLGPP